MESRVMPPDCASARQTEMGATFNRVLFDAIDALQEHQIPYALIGGIAASGLGRPRSTHDIDIFVRPEDADAALDALASHDFETERLDPRWLYKGWKDEMMVDIIFKSSGDIYFDDEMARRAMPMNYHGRDIYAVAPEDLIIIKCAVHNEIGPHHWHDALAILSHATIDWSYLVKRARRAPRRLLAILIYAQSNDIWIPNNVIVELYNGIFGESGNKAPAPLGSSHHSPSPNRYQSQFEFDAQSVPVSAAKIASSKHPDFYLVGHIHEALANETRTATLDIQLTLSANKVLAKGEVQNQDQRQAIEEVIRSIAKNFEIDNQVRLADIEAPAAEEVV